MLCLKQSILTLTIALLLPLASVGQNSESAAGLRAGTYLRAELTKPIDARKVKPGNLVEAAVTQDVKAGGKVIIRKGTVLLGHVTQAHGRTKEQSTSILGIVFDRVVQKGGEVALNAVIQAIAPPEEVMTEESISPLEYHGVYPGGARGALAQQTASVEPGAKAPGVTGTVPSSRIESENANGPAGSPTPSQGTVGPAGPNAEQTPAMVTGSVQGSAQGSMISSTNHNVTLEAGTQILLRVTGPAQ